MVGRGRVPSPGDLSSSRGHGRASDSGGGRGRASESGGGRGRASESPGGRGRALDSGGGHGRTSDSILGQKYTLNSSHGHGRGNSSTLSLEVSRTLGREYARSNSQTRRSDPMADMEGVFRHQQGTDFHHERYGGSQDGFNIVIDHDESLEDEYYNKEEDATQLGSNAGDLLHDPSQREFISRIGEKWDPSNDYVIREGFQNVIKKRYPDIMLEHRATSARKARDAGHSFPNGKPNFNIMCDFPSSFVHPKVWHDLCKGWNTDVWKKNSERGRNNRMSVDDEDVISRHKGRSGGYDEHRIILEKRLGKPPTFKELFLATHLVKESKKKKMDGLYDESLNEAVFCTTRSRKAYEEYATSMLERYGRTLLNIWWVMLSCGSVHKEGKNSG
ncbi:hypothetical protein R6Q57_019797 [Mikania cordata]